MSVSLNKKDYVWSYAGIFLSLCGSVLMTPFVVFFLDGEVLGLWYVFQSLSAITALFDFGFTTTFSRNVNYCWSGARKLERSGVVFAESSSPNFPLMKRVMCACRLVFLVLSLAAAGIMATAGTAYVLYVSSSIPGQEPLIAWLICVAAVFMNLYFGYFGAFLRGVGAIAQVNKATVAAKATQIVLTLVLLFCGFDIVGTSVAYLAYGVLFRMIARRSFYRYEGIGEGLRKVDEAISFSEVKEIFLTVWHNAWREGLVSLSNYLTNQACTIICSLFLTLTDTGAYALASQLAIAVSAVSAAMYTANQPVLQSAYITHDVEKTQRTMSLIVVSLIVLNLIGIAACVFIALPVLALIRPEVVVGPLVMIGVGLYQLMLKFRNCYTSYFSCTNRIPYVVPFLLSSALCIGLAVLMLGAFGWGIWGLIIAQVLAQAVYNAWAWPLKAHREMNLGFARMLEVGMGEFKAVVRGFVKKGRSGE